MTTPKSGITEMSQSQGNKHVTHNDAVRSLEQGARFFTVIDKDLTTPPASPTDGDAYYVPSGASAPWNTHVGEIVYSSGGGADSWKYITPKDGDVIYPMDEEIFYRRESSVLVVGQILNTTFQYKQPVRVATTANGTLASAFENGDTVDGVVLATGDRILLKNQSTGSQNGIYTVNASGAPTRATDADTSAKVRSGMLVAVEEGTVNADKLFMLTTNNPITLGTTSLSFGQYVGDPNNNLAAIAGQTTAADRLSYWTALGAAALAVLTPFGRSLIAAVDAAAARAVLLLGTAAVQNTGTSGANVPLMNGANTWSGRQILTGGIRTAVYSISDDAVATHSISATANSSALVMVFNNGVGANRPNGLFWANIAGAGAKNIAMEQDASLVFTSGVLTGTTGVDGNFTISCHTDGNIYFENRFGAGLTIQITVFL